MFPRGVDYTLSHTMLINHSIVTRCHLVSEPSSYSIITSLEAWLLIAQSFIILPYLQYFSEAIYVFPT
jgi:hypothetical protein